MDASLTQQKATTLGEQLVREFDHYSQADTLSRWMAHYIGEQMTIAAAAPADVKAEADARCFETILALWAHRAKFPNGFRPFKGFEPILKTIARLDPDERRGFYRDFQRSQEKEAVTDKERAVNGWLEFAENADYTARILIDFAMRAAAKNADNESTEAVLEAAPESDRDVLAIRRLRHREATPEEIDLEAAKAQVDRIERYIAHLKGFRLTAENAEKVLGRVLAKAKQIAAEKAPQMQSPAE